MADFSSEIATAFAGAKVDDEDDNVIDVVDKEPIKDNRDDYEINDNEIDEVDNSDDDKAAQKFINDFKAGIGYDGDITDSSLQGLIGAVKDKYSRFDDERVVQFISHLEDGGNEETFMDIQPRDVYASIELDESNTDFTEQVVREILVVIRGYDPVDDKIEINTQISDLKDSGKLFSEAERGLPKLVKKEEEFNETNAKAVQKRIDIEKKEIDEYYGNIDKVFKDKALTGFSSDADLETVRQLSMPDAKGRLGIDEILGNLEPKEIAIMNHVAYCLKNGKDFSFNTKAAKTKSEKPIHSLLSKGGANGSNKPSFADLINSKLNK